MREFPGLDEDLILHLNRWWIQHVYFHPTDKHGGIKIRPKRAGQASALDRWEAAKPKMVDQRFATFRAWALSWGWPEWLIQHRWPERLVQIRAFQEYAVKNAAAAKSKQLVKQRKKASKKAR